MDWLLQYWPYLLAVVLLVVVAARLAIMLPRFRQPARHSGERTIRVVGVGGGGGNAINHMIKAKHPGVEYIAVNTDAQVLDESRATRRVQIGQQLTKGLGAGGDAAIGREAAEEDVDELGRMVTGADLVFIAAGLGGGTGSGAAPVIAAQAREAGALTVGVVTKPFSFEGTGQRRVADIAEAELQGTVDTLLLVENDRVLDMVGEDTSMLEAFTVVNEVLARTVRAIVDVMTVPGLINLDFADVRSVMKNGGAATTGIGWASGPDRAVEAARGAVTNPLLQHDISGAGAILLNVAGASTMTMREVTKAADEIRTAADDEATIIFGTIFDDRLGDELRVTVIATKFREREADAVSAAATETVAPPAMPAVAEVLAAEEAKAAEEELTVEAAAAVEEAAFTPAIAAAPVVAAALVDEPRADVGLDEVAPVEEPAPVATSLAIGASLSQGMPWMEPAEPETSESQVEVAAPELAASPEEPAAAFDDQ